MFARLKNWYNYRRYKRAQAKLERWYLLCLDIYPNENPKMKPRYKVLNERMLYWENEWLGPLLSTIGEPNAMVEGA